MAASNGRYYLICNNDLYDNISSYRIDRIKDLKILDEDVKFMEDVVGLGKNFSLNQYMEENIYMFGGESDYIKLAIKEEFLDEFVDWFSVDNIILQGYEDGELLVRVRSNKEAMRRWALRYSLYAKVLGPKDLVDEIKEDIEKAARNYNI